MASEKICSILLFCAVILLLRDAPSAIAGDIVHDDDSTPKKPGCENQFVLVYPTLQSSLLFLSSFLGFFPFPHSRSMHGHGVSKSYCPQLDI